MAYIRKMTSYNNMLAESRGLLKKRNNYNKLSQANKNAYNQKEMMNRTAKANAEAAARLRSYQANYNKRTANNRLYGNNIYSKSIKKWRANVAAGKINVSPRVVPEMVSSSIDVMNNANLRRHEQEQLQTYWNSYPGSNEHKKNLAQQDAMRNYYAELKAAQKARNNAYKALQKAKNNAARAVARTRAFGPAHSASRKSRKTRKARR